MGLLKKLHHYTVLLSINRVLFSYQYQKWVSDITLQKKQYRLTPCIKILIMESLIKSESTSWRKIFLMESHMVLKSISWCKSIYNGITHLLIYFLTYNILNGITCYLILLLDLIFSKWNKTNLLSWNLAIFYPQIVKYGWTDKLTNCYPQLLK